MIKKITDPSDIDEQLFYTEDDFVNIDDDDIFDNFDE